MAAVLIASVIVVGLCITEVLVNLWTIVTALTSLPWRKPSSSTVGLEALTRIRTSSTRMAMGSRVRV